MARRARPGGAQKKNKKKIADFLIFSFLGNKWKRWGGRSPGGASGVSGAKRRFTAR
jgi:hypothetical protein